MNVLGASFKNQSYGRQTAKTISNRRLPASYPDRVRHDDGIGRQSFGLVLHKVFEVRTADLLLELPDKLNIHGRSVLNRIACTEQCRKGRSFIVSRSPPNVPISVYVKGERISLPLGLIGRLNIKVVVYRY